MERENKLHKRILWLTRTAVLIALLIAVQWLTAGTQAFAGQYITGTLVNCILAVSALCAGLWSGLVVALLSPFCAFLLGIGPALIQIVPCIALGNSVLVLVLWLLAGQGGAKLWRYGVAVVAAAAAKFLTLYVAVVKILIPVMGSALKAPQVQKFTAMFSVPQLITALLGGALAVALLPVLAKAIKK